MDVQNLTPDNGPGVTLRELHTWSRGKGEFLYSSGPVIYADGSKEPRSKRHFTIESEGSGYIEYEAVLQGNEDGA